MRYLLHILSLAVFTTVLAAAQKTDARIENVRMEVRDNKVLVFYDLVSGRNSAREVHLKFYTDKNQLIDPSSVSGDVGASVMPGGEKAIVWDVTRDMNNLTGKYYPRVFLDYDYYLSKHRGGPENALLSLILPGLGDYFVADPAEMKIPPYARTISSLGLIAAGIVAKNYRHHAPGEWKTAVQIQHERGRTLSKEIEYYEEGPMQYYLFKGDAEVFLLTGACIWVYDILWVSARGKANADLNKSLENQRLSLVPVHRGMGLSYRLTF